MFSNSYNWSVVIRITGILLMIESLFMLMAVTFSIYYQEDDLYAILISSAITMLAGLTIYLNSKKKQDIKFGKREAYTIVATTWIIVSIFGALPFVIHGAIPAYTDAFFETISGFTTTGATILSDIESVPKGLLFWRSTTQWMGGMGIIVLTLAVLPAFGIGGIQLFSIEVPGVDHDKLHPRITGTAKRLWGIYVVLTMVLAVFLMFGGMNLFDALCHAFTTMSTGGFSTKNASIAEFSPYIQYVIVVFMVLAATNFTLHYFVIHGRLSKLYRNEEFRFYIMVLIAASLFVSAVLIFSQHLSPGVAIRDSVFQVVSIVTTTGFITSDYMLWPVDLWLLVFLLFFTGGCAGSTSGGIKSMRNLLLFKNINNEMKRLIYPNAVLPLRYNGKIVSLEITHKIMAYFLIYIFIFALGSLIISITGHDLISSIGMVAASLGNIGPGLGSVGPVENYAHISAFGKYFLSFLMLLGRLEIFTILILLHPAFYKK